ncbi:MAG: arsenate reductase/protein-tyrosine-phosphatase family protein [Promethearchaeota archaeon]
MVKFHKIETIGIVCIDNSSLSQVAAIICRDLAIRSKNPKVRSLQIYDAGYKRISQKVSDSAKGFLQTKGFGSSDMLEIKRINKQWLLKKDLVFVMDKFLQRDILYDFFPSRNSPMRDKIFILNEVAGIPTRIRDPGDDYNADHRAVYILIEKCCQKIMQRIEKEI